MMMMMMMMMVMMMMMYYLGGRGIGSSRHGPGVGLCSSGSNSSIRRSNGIIRSSKVVMIVEILVVSGRSRLFYYLLDPMILLK